MIKYKPLSKELTVELKKEMHYIEKIGTCQGCGLHDKINGQIDGEHVSVCFLNNIGHLLVEPSGQCDYWREKKKEHEKSNG
jgi:hypothetical protein